jgi:hypothetical protein
LPHFSKKKRKKMAARREEREKEAKYGIVLMVSGPVVIAENMAGSAMDELVRVGTQVRNLCTKN